MKPLRRRGFILLLSALVAVIPPSGRPAESKQTGVVKIATQSPLSGSEAALGQGVRRGAELAVQQLKGAVERLGFKVELVPFDDQGRPEVAVANAARILADEEIVLVVGHPNSGVAIAASEKYQGGMLALISPAGHPALTARGSLTVNRIGGRDDVQGAAAAQFARATLKVKTAFLIHDKTTYGQRLVESFAAHAGTLGIELVGLEGTEEETNFDPILTPIKAKNPEVIYFGGTSKLVAAFFKAARAKGAKAIFMGPDALDASGLVKIAGKAAVGAYYTATLRPASAYPKGREWTKAYRQAFNSEPEPIAAQAFDATAVALAAIETAVKERGGAPPSRKGVSLTGRKTKYAGITGTIEFDDKGDPTKALYFVLRVVSDDPARWDENKEVARIELAAPPFKK